MHETDILVIGAGPTGLFAVFEAGILKMKSTIIDALDFIGGQCTALYPEKPIYDIPAHPKITGAELIKNLEIQASRFEPNYILGEQVISLEDQGEYKIAITSKGRKIKVKAVIIATGGGAFGPNRPPLEGIEVYEGVSVFYMVKSKNDFAGKKVAIAGGGDSALDWAIILAEIASKVYLIHRRAKFRGTPDSLEAIQKLADLGKIELITPYQLESLEGKNGVLEAINLTGENGTKRLEVDALLPFFGLSMEIGPLANWGLNLQNKYIEVDPFTMQTNKNGIYAIGDIATYKNKQKLILTGFAEAATASKAIRTALYPAETLHFEYSTTIFN
jgi:thioredoxin reductase (NADPH)